MKVSEFSEKYGLPSAIVREASFETKTRKSSYSCRDIPEEELFNAVKACIEKRIETARETIERNEKRIERLMGNREYT